MPGKALDWRHHQNWVYAQLGLCSTTRSHKPLFQWCSRPGAYHAHEPLFWYPGPRAFALHELSQITGMSLCFQQRPPKKREREDPGKQLSLYFWGRIEVTNQGREVSYQLHILLIFLEPVKKQSQQWRALGNLNIKLHRTLAIKL
jgi:hypothetical protein